MERFFDLTTEVMNELSDENMALVVGGNVKDQPATVNNGTGCGCTSNS